MSARGARPRHEADAAARLGYPCMVVSDNGTELTSNAMLAWQQYRFIACFLQMRNRLTQNREHLRGAGQGQSVRNEKTRYPIGIAG
jgi:hypothetical protein